MHMPRVVPKGGAALSGRFFPAGSIVGVSPKLVHRTSTAYGDDATTYKPERWMSENAEELKNLNRFNLAFGAGSRGTSMSIPMYKSSEGGFDSVHWRKLSPSLLIMPNSNSMAFL